MAKVKEKTNNWKKVFSRKHNLQRMNFLWSYFKTGLPQDKKIKLNNLLILPSEGKYDYFLKEDEWNDCLKQLAKYLLRENISKQKKYFKNVSKKFLKISKQINKKNLQNLTNKNLIDWFEKYLKIYSVYSFFVLTPFAIENVIYPELEKMLKQKNIKKVKKYLEIISAPIKNSQFLEQQTEILKIALLKNTNKEIKKHVEKYFWIPVNNINDKPWDENDFKKQLMQIKNPKKDLKKKEGEMSRRKINFNNFLKEFKNDQEVLKFSRLINFYVSLRDDSRDVWRQTLYYVFPFYRELSRRANIFPEEAFNFLNEEIFDFLKSNILPTDLCLRNKKHALLFSNGKTKVLTKEKEIKKLFDLLPKEKNKNELKGFAAFGGKISGVVRLIKSKEKINLLKAGEILVSHHTSPDYLLAMKKAVAFITDEGGITSHAAIIARELKIPCIIGTKNATQILKNGDLVEVDADNGVVRILNKYF